MAVLVMSGQAYGRGPTGAGRREGHARQLGPTGVGQDARSAARRGEVHEVLDRAEVAAPGPAGGGEGTGHRVARLHHAGTSPRAVQVGTGELGKDERVTGVG